MSLAVLGWCARTCESINQLLIKDMASQPMTAEVVNCQNNVSDLDIDLEGEVRVAQ